MAVSHLFLSSILAAAFFGIAFAKITWLEGSIFCVRNGSDWSPLEGATAGVVCGAFVEHAMTNKTGYFLKKLQNNTDICLVTLKKPGPNSGDCVVPDPENSFDFATEKYKDDGNTTIIYTTKSLIYNPRPDPSAATPKSSANPTIPSVNNTKLTI